MSDGAFDVSMQVFEKAAEVFSLLSTPARLRIVDELCRNELNVAQLKQQVSERIVAELSDMGRSFEQPAAA